MTDVDRIGKTGAMMLSSSSGRVPINNVKKNIVANKVNPTTKYETKKNTEFTSKYNKQIK